jgi:hypothetical protein
MPVRLPKSERTGECMLRTLNLLLLLVILIPFPALSQRIPASDLQPGELVVEPAKETWAIVTSTAFFSKPTTLIEHREMTKLRGILTSKHSSLKVGQVFSERKRLKEICTNIQQSYSALKNHVVVGAKITWGPVSYCRVRVRENDGLTVDQLLFIGKSNKKNRSYVTHTVTFFYPASDDERAAKEVVKFVNTVNRRSNG